MAIGRYHFNIRKVEFGYISTIGLAKKKKLTSVNFIYAFLLSDKGVGGQQERQREEKQFRQSTNSIIVLGCRSITMRKC